MTKIGYTITFHHSEHIRPNGKKVVKQNIESFYNSCKYDFNTFIIDNQSEPSTSFGEVFDLSLDKYKNLKYTYIKNQFEKGITGAWSLGITQAIEAGSDIVILTTDDVIIDDTINNLIEYIINDSNNNNTIYGPVASGVTVPLQKADGPTGKVFEIPGTPCPYHLGGHMYAFTKEFYHKWKSENGDLFVIDQPHNGGDGKWGGNEGNVIHWAEQGARCVVVGTCWINHVMDTRYSYRTARNLDNKKMKILLINPYDSPDYLYRSIIEGLLKYDIELYLTNPDRLCTDVVSDEDALRLANTVDYIFVIWDKEKPNVRPIPKYYLLEKINLPNKTVYIDGSEYNWTAYPGKSTETLNPNMIGKCKYYFKRECLPEHIEQGVIPLPFASVDKDFNHLPNVTKDIDVLCAFGQTDTGQRKVAVQACEELKSEGYRIINSPVSNYVECMNRAWITIDAHGGGECNARTFQVMANRSLLFMERYNIVVPDLIDGTHYVSWSDKEDLKNKLRQYLDNKEKISILTEQSYKNVLNYHTSAKRVEYIFKNLNK